MWKLYYRSMEYPDSYYRPIYEGTYVSKEEIDEQINNLKKWLWKNTIINA